MRKHLSSSRSLLLVPLLALASGACTSAQVDSGKSAHAVFGVPRGIASARDHASMMRVLEKIPLVPGTESRDESEAATAQTLIEIFNKIENESKSAGKLNRGTHAKGSCYDATVTVFGREALRSQFGYSDALVSRLKRGIFEADGALRAQLRFANAKGTRNVDTDGDVRGLSFAIDLGGRINDFAGSSRQDFMLNSSPMFLVNNIHEFTEVMKAARLASGDFGYFVNPFYAATVLRAKRLLDSYERADTKSYTTENYWSNLPYTHGLNADGTPADLVKYKATPCDGQGIQHEASSGKAANYLQTDLADRAARGSVCFLIQLQLFDQRKLRATSDAKHADWTTVDWVENGGELWDESILPFSTVAKLEIKSAPGAGSSQFNCDDWYVNTRLHSNPQNQPVGSIARVRTLIEENSRARRMNELP